MEVTQKRILSFLLSAAMLFTGLPMTAMADEEPLIQNSGQPLSLSIGVNNVSENSTKLTFSASMDGTVYYTVYRSDEQPPEESVLLTKEAVTVKEGSAAVVEGLAAQTSYTAYALLENTEGNRSAIAVAQFTTESEAAMVSVAGSPIIMLAVGAGATFTAKTSDGHTLTYKVLTEDDTLKTGTVQVGDGTACALVGTASGNLTIPETVVQNDMTYTVTAIGEKAFWGCMGFNGALTMPNSITSIGKMAFMSCNNFSGELILPSNLTLVGVGAFSGCKKFTGSLVIPNQVTAIGAMAFNGCFGLDGSLSIPDSVTWIEDNAFKNCSNFDSLALGAGETTIGISAFEGCTGFTGRLVVPGTVKSLSSKAFLGCTNLNGVQFEGNKPGIGVSVFDNCAAGFTLQYNADTYDWGGYTYNGSSPVTVIAAQAPTIIGPTSLTLDADYSATATDAYTLTGTEPITVEKTSGDSKITWNGATKKLDIEAGLTAGDYHVTLKASNGVLPDATLDFTLKVNSAAYTVTYDLNGGGGTAPTETPKELNATFTAAQITGISAPSGKQFKEWNTSQNGTGTAYAPGAIVTMPGVAFTLYAIWDNIPAVNYTITFDGNGGSVSPSTMLTGADGKLASQPTPTKSGNFTFISWFTEAIGGSAVTTDTVFTTNTTVYAHWHDTGSSVPYLDDKGVEQSRAVYTKLTTEYLSSKNGTLSSGWYLVDTQFLYENRIIISGNVHIILTDSAHMTADSGITVEGSNNLTLYGQSGKTGRLTATAGDGDAGIGGSCNNAGGTITINGGIILAQSGSGGAGIGGGESGNGGNVTINGGIILVQSSYGGAGFGGGAGIGGGLNGAGSTITISGEAKVSASGTGGGAGIGSGGGLKSASSDGNSPDSGNIEITGNANVTARGGAGSGSNTTKTHGGSGIGSGGAAGTGDSAGSVGIITINTTGTVKATGGVGDNNGANPGANIGAGGSQSGAGKPYYTITIDTQPAGNTTVTQGSITGSLSVSASVSPNGVPAYEWFSSNTNSSTGGVSTSVKTPSFTIPTDLTAGDHYYYCVVSAMGAASVPSSVATVTVTAAQPMTHTISASAGANGSISPTGSVSVNIGANQTFTIAPNSGYSIRDVKVDGTSVGAASSYEFSNVTENHTIYAEFYYSYSGSNGGSSGSVTVPKTYITTDKQPDMPTVAKMSVSGTVKDGVLSAAITEQMVKDAIKAAQDAAKKSGKEADGIAVEFNVIGSGNYTGLSAAMDAGTIDRLKESGVKFIKIGSSVLDVTLDTGAIAEVDNQSTGTVTVSARKLAKLSDAAKKLIGNRPAFDITVSYQKNGKTEYVSKFGKGIVTLGIAYEATGNENKGNLFGVYVDKNGKPQLLTNSSYDNTGRLIFSRNSLSTYGVGYKATAPNFTDTAKHWAKEHIDFVVSRGLITGSSESTFAPNTAITRADFLMALGRLSGADVSSYKTSSFTDVKGTDTAMPYIEWAVKNKIVQGIGGSKFGPDEQISRQDMAVMMQNYATATGYKLPVSRQSITFADDATISAYAKDAVKAIQQTGVVGGKGNNLFDPQGNTTRAEASTILRRFVELVIDEGTARGWVQNDAGQWQYIGENGKPAIGWLTTDGGKYHYYFTADGSMVAGKWLEIEGKWYYFNADGSLAKSTKIDGYEVDENGVRKVK